MLKRIEFKDERFKIEEDYNVLEELTENTIILCNNYKLMDTLANEIIDTVNGEAEHNDYLCDEEDVGKAKFDLVFGLQRVIDINRQKSHCRLNHQLFIRQINQKTFGCLVILERTRLKLFLNIRSLFIPC